MERKQLDVPIRDFDKTGYGEVEFILKADNVKKVEVVVDVPEDEISNDPQNGYEMLLYFCKRFNEVHGYEYVPLWDKDINIFDNFKVRYGEHAVPMIKMLFDGKSGKLDIVDGAVTPSAFSKNAKWIQDKLYISVQESNKSNENNSIEGMTTGNDFRKMFTVAR